MSLVDFVGSMQLGLVNISAGSSFSESRFIRTFAASSVRICTLNMVLKYCKALVLSAAFHPHSLRGSKAVPPPRSLSLNQWLDALGDTEQRVPVARLVSVFL